MYNAEQHVCADHDIHIGFLTTPASPNPEIPSKLQTSRGNPAKHDMFNSVAAGMCVMGDETFPLAECMLQVHVQYDRIWRCRRKVGPMSHIKGHGMKVRSQF
jgi:hypothetical protein